MHGNWLGAMTEDLLNIRFGNIWVILTKDLYFNNESEAKPGAGDSLSCTDIG